MVRPPTHAFAHRGTPATSSHSRVRWQPYHATVQSSHTRTPPYLPTPASSVSSTSPSPLPTCDDRPRHVHSIPRDCQLREAHKSRYAFSLVDQTVKSLCDIWQPQDIPSVFLTSCRPVVAMSSFSTHPCLANLQLHPPSSQTAYPSPIASPLTPCPPPVARAGVPATRHPNDDIASMKGFVHEVLRRSRTSGSVLQTALCYLEAIRQKIPDLVRQEKQGPGTALEDRSAERSIQVEDSAITADDTVLDGPRSVSGDVTSSDGFLATVRIGHAVHSTSNVFLDPRPNRDFPPVQEPKASMRALPPLPPLPSPLLCPRRTFLASLILASKFMQDRCYSNRAWAKLSGLPPREIGRCERALGEALEWRLWVGKLPAAQSDHRRSLAKSRSETDILTASKSPEPFLPTYDRMELSTPQWDPTSLPVPRSNARLKRHATHPSISSCKEEPSLVTSIEAIASSPSTCTTTPSTPGLSFSPTPTESSLGDRTIQISSFMDVPTPPPGQFAAFASAQNDKVLLASNGPCIFSTSQDSSLLSRPFEGRVHIPTNVLGFPLPPYGAMYPHWSSEYA